MSFFRPSDISKSKNAEKQGTKRHKSTRDRCLPFRPNLVSVSNFCSKIVV